MMKIGFNSKNEITNSKNLYGRDTVFNQLIGLANRKSCVQVIGQRRFGKTSLLKCLEQDLRNNSNSKIYPIYIDLKEVASEVQGTSNVYRYLIAVIIAQLTSDKIYNSVEIFRNQKICSSHYWEDTFEVLQKVEDVRISGLFEDIILFFSDLMEKTFVCLFDEYEHLFRVSFDNPTGFMKLRTFSSKLSSKGLNPFSFFVSGGITWDKLCSLTGSGEMNCIDTLVRVTPIERDHFKSMWENECVFIDNCPIEIKNGWEYAYNASGGVPFYGKVIGSNWFINSKKPKWNELKSHFQELINALETEERDVLFKLCNGPVQLPESTHVFELRDNGLIMKNGNSYSITINFLKEYIKHYIFSKAKKESNLPDTYELTDKITALISTINNTYKIKKGVFIFEPVNDDAALIKDLKTSCTNQAQISIFANSLYKILFEKTKLNGVPKSRLPKTFRNTQFIELVDIMRHSLGGAHLMATFILRPGQMTKEKMFFILTGTKNEPNAPEDFYSLQITMLRKFESELLKLNNLVRS